LPENAIAERHNMPPENANLNRARDHLANERTFLAWVRTGIAAIIFGFAIGRFSIALREFLRISSHGEGSVSPGVSAWFGVISIIGGVLLILAGLSRYKQAKVQIDSGTFDPAGFVIDIVAYLLGFFGLSLAGYLVYIGLFNK
jgi:putative membrane protein